MLPIAQTLRREVHFDGRRQINLVSGTQLSGPRNRRILVPACTLSCAQWSLSKIWILSSHSTEGSNARIAQRYLTDTSGKIPTTPWPDTDTTCMMYLPFPEYHNSAVLGVGPEPALRQSPIPNVSRVDIGCMLLTYQL